MLHDLGLCIRCKHASLDDPAETQSDGCAEDGRGDIALPDDLVPDVERGDFGQRAARAGEDADSETGEDDGVQHRDIGHVC